MRELFSGVMNFFNVRAKLALLTLGIVTIITACGTYLQPNVPAKTVNLTNIVYATAIQRSNSELGQELFELTNQDRINAGLNALTWDSKLADIAIIKAKDMVDKNYFDHDSPTYGSPFALMKNQGIKKYRVAGENLAGNINAQRAHTALMDSPTHKRNIMDSRFKQIGIGVVDSKKYGKIFVEMFTDR